MAAAGTDSPEEEVLFGGALDVRAGGTGGAWRSGVWAQLMTSTLLLSGGTPVSPTGPERFPISSLDLFPMDFDALTSASDETEWTLAVAIRDGGGSEVGDDDGDDEETAGGFVTLRTVVLRLSTRYALVEWHTRLRFCIEASVAGKRELKRGRALVLQGLEPEAVAGHHIHVFGCDATVGGGSEASERIAGCEETSLDAVHVGFVFNPFSGKYYIYNRSTNGAGTTLVRMKKTKIVGIKPAVLLSGDRLGMASVAFSVALRDLTRQEYEAGLARVEAAAARNAELGASGGGGGLLRRMRKLSSVSSAGAVASEASSTYDGEAGADSGIDQVVLQGYLTKKGQKRHSWKKRFFVLTPSKLLYYETSKMKKKRGEVLMHGAELRQFTPDLKTNKTKISLKRTFGFDADKYRRNRFIILAADGRDLHVVADSEREYNEWFLSVGEITDPETFGRRDTMATDGSAAEVRPGRLGSEVLRPFRGAGDGPRVEPEPVSTSTTGGSHRPGSRRGNGGAGSGADDQSGDTSDSAYGGYSLSSSAHDDLLDLAAYF